MTEDEMVGWHHLLNGYEFLNKLWELVMDRESWHAALHGVTKNWTTDSELKSNIKLFLQIIYFLSNL